MAEQKKIKENFEQISRKIVTINKSLESILPHAIVKETTSFGNSSHVVLSKELLHKRVGVIVLGDKNVNCKGEGKRR
jgi:putative transposon-encoded protein